ncbi:Cytoplasmic protein [Mycena venus]|uniref:Cytoplasmic protein n=1 Tax=Mycena venus TaxID=2733690 RepID=A0A8H6XSA4_9AGAR|nr:Cytoplasmic protein [Mycena venus]
MSIDWRSLQSSLNKGFTTSVQATKERLGRVGQDEITELPQEYKDLEARVDALRQAHLTLLKITKVYESEAYDYPSQIQESIAELSALLHRLRPHRPPTPAHKTLPHALGRAAASAAAVLQATAPNAQGEPLGSALGVYAQGMEKVAAARVEQDAAIRLNYLHPWQQTLTTSITVALKARQAVRTSRLELDGAKQTLKNASAAKQEHARLEVENAEDDLVQKTEVAIALMEKVLKNPEPIKHLNELAKAQLIYFAHAAETLSNTQAELEELSMTAEEQSRSPVHSQQRRQMSSDESIYEEVRKMKRRKGNDGLPTSSKESFSLKPLLDLLDDVETPFEDSVDRWLPEYLHDRAVQQEKESEKDSTGQLLRPLTRSDIASFLDAAGASGSWSVSQAVALRKLKVGQERRRAGWTENNISTSTPPALTELQPSASAPLPEQNSIIEALESIRTTPFEKLFFGTSAWSTPWMSLMSDIRDHYTFAHPERDHPSSTVSPITYSSLEPWHLDQVHDLLNRAFWSGIDVSDSLEYSPERCTIIAAYGRLVVGVAIISSPRETYITYLAVRAGWDNAQIATTMLYHLITLNPHQDITLHVSANNSAMLLYNRFGFKAEEFVAGFYDAYLDPQSRASKNAFRLRLRQH